MTEKQMGTMPVKGRYRGDARLPLCYCGHMKSEHSRRKGWCRVKGCNCIGYIDSTPMTVEEMKAELDPPENEAATHYP